MGNVDDTGVPTSWETGLALRGRAVRFSWDPQPGVIEVEFEDADGIQRRLIDKTVMFYEYDAFVPPGPPPLPVDVTRPCYIVADLGGGRVRIALSQDGEEFEVMRDTLIVVPTPTASSPQ